MTDRNGVGKENRRVRVREHAKLPVLLRNEESAVRRELHGRRARNARRHELVDETRGHDSLPFDFDDFGFVALAATGGARRGESEQQNREYGTLLHDRMLLEANGFRSYA